MRDVFATFPIDIFLSIVPLFCSHFIGTLYATTQYNLTKLQQMHLKILVSNADKVEMVCRAHPPERRLCGNSVSLELTEGNSDYLVDS